MKGTILLLAALLLIGCGEKQDTASSGKPVIFTSIQPQAGLLKRIVGDSVAVHTLVGEGQSPHSYEPSAKQLAALGEAEMLFTIGMPFEEALLKKIKPLYPDLVIVETDSSIEKRSISHSHECENCTHDHGAPDPHVWLSVRNAGKIAGRMSETLKDDLISGTGFGNLVYDLRELDKELTEMMAPYKGCRFYVFHPSFGYFAEAYGLEQVPIELDGKSPSPRQLVALIEQAKADGVKVIFVQKQFPADSANAMAEAIDGRVVQLDPLAEDVVANLRLIANAIEASYK